MKILKHGFYFCPLCWEYAVYIGVHDDEGNFKGELGCEYEEEPWSGLSYGLHHEDWGSCLLCTSDIDEPMGGVLFDTAEEAAEEWWRIYEGRELQ